MKPKIGGYYTVDGSGCFGIFKVLRFFDADDRVLIEFSSDAVAKGYLGLDMKDDLLERYSNLTIKEGRDYEGISATFYTFKHASRKIRDTKLSRKMYPEIVKEKEGYIYVRY